MFSPPEFRRLLPPSLSLSLSLPLSWRVPFGTCSVKESLLQFLGTARAPYLLFNEGLSLLASAEVLLGALLHTDTVATLQQLVLTPTACTLIQAGSRMFLQCRGTHVRARVQLHVFMKPLPPSCLRRESGRLHQNIGETWAHFFRSSRLKVAFTVSKPRTTCGGRIARVGFEEHPGFVQELELPLHVKFFWR